jgi:hypothetical protein
MCIDRMGGTSTCAQDTGNMVVRGRGTFYVALQYLRSISSNAIFLYLTSAFLFFIPIASWLGKKASFSG